MRAGKEGEYYYIVLESEDELNMLKEMVIKKIRERSGQKREAGSL